MSTDLLAFALDRHAADVAAGKHDDECEWRSWGHFICNCGKRERLARGLTEPPPLYINYPTCGGCDRTVGSDGDGFTCATCHAFWPYRAGDGDRGQFTDDFGDLDPDGSRDKGAAPTPEPK